VVRPWQNERIPVNLDIRVWGMDVNGCAFSQRARAHNVSVSGALLSEIEHELKIGDTIAVQTTQKKTRCKVVWARNTGSIQKIQVGVQLLSDSECPWNDYLPKIDQHAQIVAPGRRRWIRHKIDFAIALHDERALLRLTATDVSGSGCYVEMLSPFPIGTALDAEIWIGAQRVTTRALVRTCDPRVGMGIEFVGLKTEDQKRFQDYLQAINPFSCSIEYQNPNSRNPAN
jgi:PilZ domain